MSTIIKSFILHNVNLQILDILTDEQAGLLFKAIRNFQLGNEQCTDEVTRLVLSPFLSQFKKDKKKSRRNEDHWNWKGGISSENAILRNSAEYKEWRKSVFDRDNYTCQKCFTSGAVLNAHHIKHWAKYKDIRFDINNGLTLCKPCHIEVHREG